MADENTAGLSWLRKYSGWAALLVATVLLAVGAYLIEGQSQPSQPVTYESQLQAETPAGVEKAATAAAVPLLPMQAAMIAEEIKEAAANPPDAVVQTNGAKLEDTAKTEVQKSGGQFAIVTDPKDPAKSPVLPTTTGKAVTTPANVGTISPNTPVTLNQYNIKVYPDHLFQVGGSYKEVLAAYSWKVDVPKIPLIVPNGGVGYLGVYGHANFDRPDMSRAGIILTIPK
jgi:hypothetical protein